MDIGPVRKVHTITLPAKEETPLRPPVERQKRSTKTPSKAPVKTPAKE